jgi:hypothetical protein
MAGSGHINTADLYFVSSDYHIYRCASLIIQLFAHSKTKGNIYALNAEVRSDGSERVLRFAELGSMYQPYEQLTFDVSGKMNIQFKNYQNSVTNPIYESEDFVNNSYNTLFRMLTLHGFYNRYDNTMVNEWQTNFRIYHSDGLKKIGLYREDGQVLSGGSRKLLHKNDNAQVNKTRKSKHPKTKRNNMRKKIKRTKMNKYIKPSSKKSK